MDIVRKNRNTFARKFWIARPSFRPGAFAVVGSCENPFTIWIFNPLSNVKITHHTITEIFTNQTIDGYSLIGACMISPCNTITQMKENIEYLLNGGISPTKEDYRLSRLFFYGYLFKEVIERHTNILLLFSSINLDQDVINYVKQIIVDQLFETYRAYQLL